MPHKRTFIPHVCEQCGVTYPAERYRVAKGLAKYCSRACCDKGRTIRIEHTCEECGATFSVRPSTIATARKNFGERGFRFCSRTCAVRNRCHGVYEERICEHCGNRFTFKVPPAGSPHESKNPGKYCSRKCANLGQDRKITKRCIHCGKSFRVQRKNTDAKYCDARCAGRIVDHVERTCATCGESFWVPPSQSHRQFCSRDCSHERLRKTVSDTAPHRARFIGARWRAKRALILERDGGVCTRCGSHIRLAVHHVIPWRLCHDDSPENLITLCHYCHPIVEMQTVRTFLS